MSSCDDRQEYSKEPRYDSKGKYIPKRKYYNNKLDKLAKSIRVKRDDDKVEDSADDRHSRR